MQMVFFFFFFRIGQKSHEYRSRNKGFDILSFDGGGTLGVMEAMILKHIMNTVTILVNNQAEMKDWDYEVFKNCCFNLFKDFENDIEAEKNNLEKLYGEIEKVKQPVHPTKVFDMIVGTSTGEFISKAIEFRRMQKTRSKTLEC